jgi:RNA polymerase sigma factor (sigma-70 family)
LRVLVCETQDVMTIRAESCGILWDFAVAESLDASQRWILSAMQNNGEALITILWRLLGNEQDVCDAYQETFLQLAHHEGRQKPDNVKAYLFRTATNTAISMLRRKEMQDKFIHSVAAEKSPQSADTAGDLDAKQLQTTLRKHITQLPEHLRNVILLHDLGELSYEQVGRMLQIPSGTARVYRCKAVQLLAVWMSEK